VGKAPGALTYTQMLNARGGIECDLTVARLGRDDFYLVTGTGFATHDFNWIARNIPAGCAARLRDVTSSYAVLALMGPRARDVLASLTSADVSNAAFPFASWREIFVAGAPVRALRITYVGELGWELHVPVEYALSVYTALMQAGAAFGIRAGVGRETLYRDDVRAGWLSSAGWGYTAGTNIGFGYLRDGNGVSDAMLMSGHYELDAANKRVPCALHRQPLYDPASLRVRG
jgi:4-methylaminobutanoate oxidase (formaldehyde-forming)